MPPGSPVEFLRGAMELLILRALFWGPAHGYALARWIENATEESLQIEEDSTRRSIAWRSAA